MLPNRSGISSNSRSTVPDTPLSLSLSLSRHLYRYQSQMYNYIVESINKQQAPLTTGC
jgi:hypothetical protein